MSAGEAAERAASAAERTTAPKHATGAPTAERKAEAEAAMLADMLREAREANGQGEAHTFVIGWLVTNDEMPGYGLGDSVYIKARGISDVIGMLRYFTDKGMLITSVRNESYLGQ